MSENQNFCELYVSLVPHHENLKSHCESLSNVLQGVKDERKEKQRQQFKENVGKFLKQLNEKLLENLNLLKMVAFDMGSDYVSLQCNLKAIEGESEMHQEKLNAINKIINSEHKAANFKIHETREDFLKKFNELMDSKNGYDETQKQLDENCKIQLTIEEQLNCKRNELKKVLCQIIKYRSTMQPNIPMDEFDDLRNFYEKATLKLTQLNSTVNCYQTKIAQTQHESEYTRKFFRSELRVIREHDKWSTNNLMKRKNILENRIECICSDESVHEIKKIEREVFIMQEKIEMSEVSMAELKKIINKFESWKRPCPKVSSAILRKRKEMSAPIFGTDYLGSKFIKLQ